MSITVATSTVDTSWQEIDVVSFTAGILSGMREMVEEVEGNLNRGELGTTTSPTRGQVQKWLIFAKERLAAIKNFQESKRYAYASTVSGSYEYSLPPDFRGGHITLRDTTSGEVPRPINIISSDVFDRRYPNPGYSQLGNVRPDVATVKGRKLVLRRPADGVYTLEVQYNRSGDDVDDEDVSWLPEMYRDFCVEYATYRAFRMLRDPMYEVYYRDWMDDIKLSRIADGKHRWASHSFQCPPWMPGSR